MKLNKGEWSEVYVFLKLLAEGKLYAADKDLKKIEWNFEKFLLNSDGVPVRRYRPGILPSQVEGDVNDLIKSGKLKPRQKAMLGV